MVVVSIARTLELLQRDAWHYHILSSPVKTAKLTFLTFTLPRVRVKLIGNCSTDLDVYRALIFYVYDDCNWASSKISKVYKRTA